MSNPEETQVTARRSASLPGMAGPFGSSEAFEHSQRVAQALLTSGMVPEHMRNIGAILVAMHIAVTHNEDLFAVLQAIHVVKGKVGFTGSYLKHRIDRSGLFKTPLNLIVTGSGESLVVTARAVEAMTGEVREISASYAMAKADGWTNNPKYKSMPEIMLRNRAIAFFARYVCPGVVYGYMEAGELEDVEASERVIVEAESTPPPKRSASPKVPAPPRPALPDHSALDEVAEQVAADRTRARDPIPANAGAIEEFEG